MREIKFRGKVNGEWWHVQASDEQISDLWEQFWALVDRKTVGECIGVACKNGDIYEGDILQMYGGKYILSVQRSHVCFHFFDAEKERLLRITDLPHIEIIGTIYDNPEFVRKPHHDEQS